MARLSLEKIFVTKEQPDILNELTDVTVKTEGLVPGQTPLRITNKTMRGWSTIQGIPIDRKANIPSDRQNFFFVKPGQEKEVIKRQYKNYFKNPTKYGLPEDATVEDAVKKFDQENPKNKLNLLKQRGIDIKKKLKEFDISMLNPFKTEEAYADEKPSLDSIFAKPSLDNIFTKPSLDTIFSEKPSLDSIFEDKKSFLTEVDTPYGKQKAIRPLIEAGKKFKEKIVGPYLEEAQAAFKWAVSGMPRTWEDDPKKFNRMSWGDVIRESYPMLKDPKSKLSRSVMAQFGVEMASDLLEIGTKPSTYIAMGAAERLIPIALRGIYKKLPKGAQEALIKERFMWGRNPVDMAYKEFGLKPGAKFEDVTKAYREATIKFHPDRAPAGQAINYTHKFIRAQGAYDKIKASTAIAKEVAKAPTKLPEAEITPQVPAERVTPTIPAKVPPVPPTTPKTPIAEGVPEAIPPKAPIIGEGETKIRGLAKGVEEKAVENKLTDNFGDLPEYKTVSMKDQAIKAQDLLTQNPILAKNIAMGKELSPDGLLPESVFVAVENKAIKESDVETLKDLATSSRLTEEATTMGQRIRTLAERDPESPVTAINDIAKSRQRMTQRKNKGKDIKRITNETVNKIRTEISKLSPTKETWATFIRSLQC